MEDRNKAHLYDSSRENDDKSPKKLKENPADDTTSREKTHGGGTCGEKDCHK